MPAGACALCKRVPDGENDAEKWAARMARARQLHTYFKTTLSEGAQYYFLPSPPLLGARQIRHALSEVVG